MRTTSELRTSVMRVVCASGEPDVATSVTETGPAFSFFSEPEPLPPRSFSRSPPPTSTSSRLPRRKSTKLASAPSGASVTLQTPLSNTPPFTVAASEYVLPAPGTISYTRYPTAGTSFARMRSCFAPFSVTSCTGVSWPLATSTTWTAAVGT